MIRSHQPLNYRRFILLFVLIKLILNILAISNFGFHRDELLHLALADHLDWGYKEVPPFIAVLAYITIHLFGTTVFAARISTTLCAALIVWLTGLITVELGGRKMAIILACGSIILAPAFAASQYLFQPVVFDQFWWVLSAWLAVRYIKTSAPKYLYWLGAAVGFGMLTKYSMAFFAFALLLGALFTHQRRMFINKHVLIAIGIATLIFMPNIVWQLVHHIPFFTHMRELKEQQLDYNSPANFIKHELTTTGLGLFIWLPGLIALLFASPKLRNYRLLAWAFLLVFSFLLLMDGKSYYLFGAFPMLFAAGGTIIERIFNKRSVLLRSTVIIVLLIPHLLILPMMLPVLGIKQTIGFFNHTRHMATFKSATIWEDHKPHTLSQDYADMFGWEEMAAICARAYYSLTPAQQKETIIFANNYGQAGAIHQYRHKYNIPDVVSLNSSFALWASSNVRFNYIIYIDDKGAGNVTYLAPMLESWKKVGCITDTLARENGTCVFLLSHPKPALHQLYENKLAKTKLQ